MILHIRLKVFELSTCHSSRSEEKLSRGKKASSAKEARKRELAELLAKSTDVNKPVPMAQASPNGPAASIEQGCVTLSIREAYEPSLPSPDPLEKLLFWSGPAQPAI